MAMLSACAGGNFRPVSDAPVRIGPPYTVRGTTYVPAAAPAYDALGYASWSPGQLENEIAQNGWLTCPADPDLLFDADIGATYDRLLASLGVDPLRLSQVAGHA